MEALGIDYKLLIAQVINFFLFFLIFKKYLAKPLARFISQQKEKEHEKEKLLVELKTKEELMKKKEEDIIKKAHEQAALILKEIKDTSEQMRKDLLKKAQEEIDYLKNQNKKNLEEERAGLYAEIKKETLKASLLLLKSGLKNFVDESLQKSITQQLLQKFKKTEGDVSYEN